MRVEKKQITKEDGRYLVYYHFPDTASDDQTRAFQSADTPPAAPAPPAEGAGAPQTKPQAG